MTFPTPSEKHRNDSFPLGKSSIRRLTDNFHQFTLNFFFGFRFRNISDEQSRIRHADIRFDDFARTNGKTVQLDEQTFERQSVEHLRFTFSAAFTESPGLQ